MVPPQDQPKEGKEGVEKEDDKGNNAMKQTILNRDDPIQESPD